MICAMILRLEPPLHPLLPQNTYLFSVVMPVSYNAKLSQHVTG